MRAGPYSTCRLLIETMMKVIDPRIGATAQDPACGTGGLPLSAYEHMRRQPRVQDSSNQRKLCEQLSSNVDIVDGVVRLCGINLHLHGSGNSPL